MQNGRIAIASTSRRTVARGLVRGAETHGRRVSVVSPHRVTRQPPTGSAVDRLAALVERSIQDLSGEISRVQARVESSEGRTAKDIHDLVDEFRRESAHLNERIERFHEAAQLGISQVREELRERDHAQAEGAARGAAEGATKAAGAVAAGVAKVVAGSAVKSFWSSWTGKVAALATGFTALMVGANNIPDLVRAINRIWAFLGGGR